jgi:hypothetical protein
MTSPRHIQQTPWNIFTHLAAIRTGTRDMTIGTKEAIPFGHAMRDEFLFDDGWTNLNHGKSRFSFVQRNPSFPLLPSPNL